MEELRRDTLPGTDYVLWQSDKVFSFTTDAVFLAAFPHLVRYARVLELGSGTGAISHLLAHRGAAQVVGVDINPTVTELFQRSVQDNKLEDIIHPVVSDLRDLPEHYPSESFDLVVANPPYRIGGKRRVVGRAACHEEDITLEDFIQMAAYMVKYRGRFALVQLPERFAEAIVLAKSYGLEIKKLQWVHSFVHKPAWIFLAEFVKGGSPGLEVLPPLIMYNPDGSYTTTTLEYYGISQEAKP